MPKRNRVIIEEVKAYLDPTNPDTSDFDQVLPITTLDAVRDTVDPNSETARMILRRIVSQSDQALATKQNIMPAGTSGSLTMYTGTAGELGELKVTDTINLSTAITGIPKIPNEKAVSDAIKITNDEIDVSLSDIRTQIDDINTKLSDDETNLSKKVDKNPDIIASTATKVTYDAKGLVTLGEQISANDVPELPMAKISGLTDALLELGSTGAITDIQDQINRKVEKNTAITAGTFPKISYDSKGLVTQGMLLTPADIPVLPQSKIQNLDTAFANKLDKNTDITPRTATKVTYDAKGLVISSGALEATDIPSIPQDKVTGLAQSLSDLNVTTRLDQMQSDINTKADSSQLTAKANQTDLTATDERVSTLETNVSDIKTTLPTKANQADLVTAQETLQTNIDDINQQLTPLSTTVSDNTTNIATNKSDITQLQLDVQNKLNTPTTPVTTGTYTKLTVASTGLVVDGSNITADDIPTLEISKINTLSTTLDGKASVTSVSDLETVVSNKLDKNTAITAATHTKITYDTNGLVTDGSDLVADDIPEIPTSKVTGLDAKLDSIGTGFDPTDLQNQINNKVDKNTDITAGTFTKVTVDTKGLITLGENLQVSDMPAEINSRLTTIETALPGFASQTDVTALQTSVANKLDKNTSITAGTHTKITYDTNGLVTNGEDLTENDIPMIPTSKVTDLDTTLSGKASTADLSSLTSTVNSKADASALASFETSTNDALATKVTSNADITAATHSKITYDSKGLVTDGSDLVQADIPNIEISQVNGLSDALANSSGGSGVVLSNNTDNTVQASWTGGNTAKLVTDVSLATSLTGLATTTQLDSKLDKNTDIVAGSGTKITYDTKGLVLSSTNITVDDIPSLTISKITDLQTSLDGKVNVLTTPATAGTYQSVTINSDGLVTTGGPLTADMVPALATSQITNLDSTLAIKANQTSVDALSALVNSTISTVYTKTHMTTQSGTVGFSHTGMGYVEGIIFDITDADNNGVNVLITADDIEIGNINVTGTNRYAIRNNIDASNNNIFQAQPMVSFSVTETGGSVINVEPTYPTIHVAYDKNMAIHVGANTATSGNPATIGPSSISYTSYIQTKVTQ